MNKKIFCKLTALIICVGMLFFNIPLSVFASDISGITPTGNTYNIEAAKVSGSTGFRHYDNFTLTQGDIANLIYKDNYSKFVNLVNSQININGIVNTMKGGNFYNGHAIFVSPLGMVIGASGVLNVGSLSVLTPSQSSFDKFLGKYNAGNLADYEYGAEKYKGLITDSNGNVVINGKIFAREGVNIYGSNIKVEGSSTDNAGIIAGVQNHNITFDNYDAAKTLFNTLVSNNITDTTNFALENGKIIIVANKNSGFSDSSGDVKTSIDIKNANIGANDIDISSTSKVDRQERIDLAEAKINIENSNIMGDTVSIVAEASQNKKLNISSIEDDLTAAVNTFSDIFGSDTPTVNTLWGTAGKANAEINIKNSIVQALKTYSDGNNKDASIVINAIASSETEENANFLTPTILDFLSSPEAKIEEYFSNDIYTGFEGAKSSAKVTIDNSNIKAVGDNSGDIFISSDASSSLDANNRILSFVLPVGMYGVGVETESKVNVLNNSVLKAENGGIVVNAISTNENAVCITNDSTVNVVLERAYIAMLLNNTVKSDTEASIINSTINANNLTVLATNLSDSEAEVSMESLAGSKSQGSEDAGNSSLSVVGVLNRSNNNITALIKDSQIITEDNVNIVAESLNITQNVADASVFDLMVEQPKTFDQGIKDKLKGFQLKYLNHSIFDKIKGKQLVKAEESAFLEAGGAIVWNNTNNNATAKIENSTVNAKDVSVKTNTIDLISNSAAADTQGEEKVGLGVSVIYNEQHNTTNANVDGSNITAKNLTVNSLTELPMNEGKLTFGLKLPFSIAGIDKIEIGARVAGEANGDWDINAVYPQSSGDADFDFEITGLAEQNIRETYEDLKPKARMLGFFNNLAQSNSSASKADVSGSVIYNEVGNNTTADITGNSLIVLSDGGNLDVNAVNSVMGFNGAGLVDIIIKQINYKIPGQKDWKYEPTADGGKFGIGVNFLWNDYTNNATAKIENSTVNVSNGNVNVNSATEQEYFTLTLTGGKSNAVGIDGSIQSQKLKGTTLAQIVNDTKGEKNITAKNINVSAGKAKVKTTGGKIERDSDNFLKLNNERDAKDLITNIIIQGALTSQYEEINNTVQQNSFGIAVGASVDVTNIDRTVMSEINNAVLNADDVKVYSYSENKSFNLELAGAFSGGVTQKQNDAIDAQGAANNAQDEDDNDNIFGNLFDGEDEYMRNPVGNALSELQSQFSLSAAGSVIVTDDSTNVESSVKNSTVNTKNSLEINAERESNITNVTGTVAKSKKVGAGAAVNVYKQEGSVKSFIEDNSEIVFTGQSPKLDITANNTNKVIDIAIGAGVASNSAAEGKGFQAAVGGNASINTFKPEIDAYIKGSTITSNGGNIAVKLEGKNALTIYNIAGGGSYLSGASSGISAGAAFNYNNIKNTINSYIEDSTLNNIKTLDVLASAKNDMKEFAVAGAIVADTSGFNIGFAGSADVDYIHDTINAKIINSTITSNDNINVIAESNSENLQVAGSFDYNSGNSGVGVNGDVAVNVYRNDINSEIDENSKILKANNVVVAARSTEKANVIPVGISISPGENFAMLAANVGVNDIENNVKASMNGEMGTDTNKVKNVNVSAYDETTLYTRGGTLAVASADTSANIAGAFNRDLIHKTVEASITGATIKSDGDVSVSAASINSLGGTKNSAGAYDRDNITSANYNDKLMKKDSDGNYSGLDFSNDFGNWNMFYNLSAGAAASVSGAVVIKTVDNDIKAEISGANVISKNLNVIAEDYSVKNIIAGQIAASNTAAVGAQVLKIKDSSETTALISNSSNITVTNALNMSAVNKKDDNQIVVAVAAGKDAAGTVNGLANTIDDNNTAKIDGSTIKAGTLNLTSDEDMNSSKIMVAVAGSATGAVNAAPILNKYLGSTLSEINNAIINDAAITLQSDTDIKTRDIAVGVAGAGEGFAGAGLAIKNTYDTVTKAIIDTNSKINTAKDIIINANSVTNSNNWIVGASGVGEGVSAVANVIINNFISDVEASISDSEIINAGNITLNTNKDKKDELSNNAISANFVGEGATASSNVIYNIYENNVTTKIYNTDINNSSSITLQAFSDRKINNINTGVSIAGIGADLLANAIVNEIGTSTLSTVDAQSKTINSSGKLTVKTDDNTYSDLTMGFGVGAGLGVALGCNINLYDSDNLVRSEILSNTDGHIIANSAEISSKTTSGMDTTIVQVAAGLGAIAGDVQLIRIGKSTTYTTSDNNSHTKTAVDKTKTIYEKSTDANERNYKPDEVTKLETGSIARVQGNLETTKNIDIKSESSLKGKNGSDLLELTNVAVKAGGTAANVGIKNVKINNNTIAEITGGNVTIVSGDVSVGASNNANVKIRGVQVEVGGATVSGGSEVYNNTSNTLAQIGSANDNQTTVKANNINVVTNSVSKTNIDADHVVVGITDYGAVDLSEAIDNNNSIARITGKTNIDADGKLNIHSTTDTDLYSAKGTVKVNGVSGVTVSKNEVRANTIAKAIIENVEGTIKSNGLDLITDYNVMSAYSKSNVTAVQGITLASHETQGAVVDANFTSGIFDSSVVQENNNSKTVYEVSDVVIDNSGTTTIETAKKLGTNKISAKSEAKNVSVKALDFFEGTFLNAKNTAASNTFLMSNNHRTNNLNINSNLDSIAEAVLTATKVTITIGVQSIGTDATDTSNLNMNIAGNNTITNSAVINAIHNTDVHTDLEGLSIGIVTSGQRIRINAETTANTTGNVGGEFNADSAQIAFNTSRNSTMSKSSGSGGFINVSDSGATNTLTGSSVLNVNGLISDNNTANNNFTIKNTSTNTFNTTTSNGSGGVINVSSGNETSVLNTSTTTNIKNSNINSNNDVVYEVTNNTVIEDSGSDKGGGLVSVLSSSYNRTYTSGAYLNLEDTEIHADNIKLNTLSDIRSKNDNYFSYKAGGGGVISVNSLSIDNTLNQTSKIDLKNSKLYAQNDAKLSANTTSRFKQKSENDSRGFYGAPDVTAHLTSTYSNIMNFDSGSVIQALNNAVFDFDSSSTLASKVVSEAYGFAAPAKGFSYLKLTINNELNNNGEIHAGALADINYMNNSFNNLTNQVNTLSKASVAHTVEEASLDRIVNNKLIIPENSKIISNNDIEVNYAGGTDYIDSYMRWDTYSLWCIHDDKTTYPRSTPTNNSLTLNGEMVAGQGSNKYIKINKDGTIDEAASVGLSTGEYSLTGGELVDGDTAKNQKLNLVVNKIKTAEDDLIIATDQKTNVENQKTNYETEKQAANDVVNDFNELVDSGYTLLNTQTTDDTSISAFDAQIQSDLESQIVGEGESKLSAEKYTSFLNAYSAEIQSLSEYNKNPENETKNYPTLMEFLNDDTSLGLTSAQKNTINTAYTTSQNNIKSSTNGSFKTYTGFNGTKYAGVKNPTTVGDNKTCDEITNISTKIETLNSQIEALETRIAHYNEAITNLNGELTTLRNEKSAIENTDASEFAISKDDAYSIVFNDMSSKGGRIKIDGMSNKYISGTGTFNVANTGFKVDNYSTRSLIFNSIDSGLASQAGLIIDSKNYSKFANSDKAVNGTKAYEYMYGNYILYILPLSPVDFSEIGTSGAHYITEGSNAISSGIIINNFYDNTNPFAKDQNIPNPTLVSDIIFNRSINSNGEFSVFNDSGSIIAKDSINAQSKNLIATKGDVNLSKTGLLTSSDNIFAGNSVNIDTSNDVQANITAGYNKDLILTITDEMLNNLVYDPVTGENILIDLGNTPWANETNNIKALYKDNQIHLYNVNNLVKGTNRSSRGKIVSSKQVDTNNIKIYDGYQNINIDNQTDKQLNVYNIANSRSEGGLFVNGNKEQSAQNVASANIMIFSIGKLVTNGIIRNGVINSDDVYTLDSSENGQSSSLLLSSLGGGIEIKEQNKYENGTGNIISDAIYAEGSVLITNENNALDEIYQTDSDTIIAGDIEVQGNLIIKQETKGKMDITSLLHQIEHSDGSTGSIAVQNMNSLSGGVIVGETAYLYNEKGDIGIRNFSEANIDVNGTLYAPKGEIDIFNMEGNTNINANTMAESISVINTTETPIINITKTLIATNGDITVQNNNGNLTIAETARLLNYSEDAHDITIFNEDTADKLIIAGKVENHSGGNISVTNAGTGGTDISGSITNPSGNITIDNKQNKLDVTGAIETNNGSVIIKNNGDDAVIGGTASVQGGDLIIQNGLDLSAPEGSKMTISADIYHNYQDENEQGYISIVNGANAGTLTITSSIQTLGIGKNIGEDLIAITIDNQSDNAGLKLDNSEISARIGDILISNQNSDLQIVNGNITNTEQGNIKISNSGGKLTSTAAIDNTKGDVILSNAGDGILQFGGHIINQEGSTDVINEGIAAELTGFIENYGGKTTITNKKGIVSLVGNILNSGGNISITNEATENSGMNISGSMHNSNGAINISNSDGILRVAENATIINGTGDDYNDITISNSGSNLEFKGGILNNYGKVVITNTGGLANIGGDISVTSGGDIEISNSNSGALNIGGIISNITNDIQIINSSTDGLNMITNTAISNFVGNTNIINTGGDLNIQEGANISNLLSGAVNIENSGEGKLIFAGIIENTGFQIPTFDSGVNIKNTSNKGIEIGTTGTIHNNEGNIDISNTGVGGIDIQGIIQNDKQDIILTNKDSNITIGEYTTNNDSYLNAVTGNINITQINGNILNNITDTDTSSKHQNYDLGNPNHSYKTLIVAGNDLVINATDGNIGSTTNAAPGVSIDASTRDYTESINVNVGGSIVAHAINNDNIDSRIINLRAKDSNLTLKEIISNGNVILTAADWKQADTRPTPDDSTYFKGYSVLNDAVGNNATITGQNISIIASDKIGDTNKKLVYVQDTLNAPNSMVSFESENDLNLTGKANSVNETKIYQIISKHGNIGLDFESNAAIKEITSGKGLEITQKAQNLTIYDLGMSASSETAPSSFEDLLNPHDDLVYGVNPLNTEKSVIPNYINIKVLDAMDTPGRSDSTLKIYSAYVKGNHGENINYYENGTRLADVTLMADNIFVNSYKAPGSAVSTITNPNGYMQSDKIYTNAAFGGDGSVVYEAKGINACGEGESLSLDILGVDKDIVDALVETPNRNQYITQNSINDTSAIFYNPNDEIAYYGSDYKAKNAVISVNDYANTNRGVVFDTLYVDNAYLNTKDTNLNIGNGYVTNYAEIRNNDKIAVVDNDFRRIVNPANVQLYTQKTGSFALELNSTINMKTTAPTVYNNPYMLVNGYHSEWNFVNKGQKESKDLKENIKLSEALQKKYDESSRRISMRFDTTKDTGLQSNVKIYDISTTGALIKNDRNLKQGKTTTINIKFDDVDVDVKAKVVNISGDRAGVEFINMPKDVANKILYRYMQKEGTMKISKK